MADPKTWIDVADTAVKVGLGALIGGGFSYLLTRLNHDRESIKEYAKRRLNNIELAFEEINEFSKIISLYWANLANGIFKKEKGTLTKDDKGSLNDEEQHLFESFSLLNGARTKLVLLAETKSVEKLDQYKTACEDFFKIANIDGKNCTKRNLTEHKEKMIHSRDKLLEAMSKTYGKNA